MLRSLLFLGLVIAAAAFAITTPAESTPQIGPGPTACNLYDHHPVVDLDVTGGTLLGPVHQHMTVYKDGFVTISRKSSNVLSGVDDLDVQTTNVSAQEAHVLLRTLAGVGGLDLCDQPLFISDIPLTSVTLSTGQTDAKTHSFSYWIGTGDYAGVSQTIQAFIATHFPNF